MLDSITPVVITYNEQENIARSLESLRWARRVVVLDSFSTDATLELARSFPNTEIVQHAFRSFADQWNYAIAYAGSSDWILRLDADYVVSNELIDELRLLVPPANVSAYRCAFTYCIDGRPLRGTLYPPDIVLFRPRAARFEQDGHAQRCHVREGGVEMLSGKILHDDRKPLARWLQSQARYASQEAAKLADASKRALRWPDRIRRVPFLAAAVVPWYCLLAKGCILDGRAGLTYTAQRTTAELIITMKLLESRPGKRQRGVASDQA